MSVAERRDDIEGEFTPIDGAEHLPVVDLKNREIAWKEFTDDALVVYHRAAAEERQRLIDRMNQVSVAIENEWLRRLKERKARTIPSKDLEISLEDVLTQYEYDLDALVRAKALLPEEEGAKVVRLVPEETKVIPAHLEHGNPVSIAALQRKYGTGNPVGDALAAGMRRQKIDEKLVVKPRKGAA